MRALFLSYDGLTDPLGGSQIIPYVCGLAESGHSLIVLSFEKPDRFHAGRDDVARVLEAAGVRWVPFRYTKRPPVLATVFDLAKMILGACWLALWARTEVVHCRSYVPSVAGSFVSRIFGAAFVFDMRGFWADERVDGGLWDLRRFHYRLIYRFFKRRETTFLRNAHAVVSLTESGLREMESWNRVSGLREKTSVIPCSVDLRHFDPLRFTAQHRGQMRARLGLGEHDLLCGYSGSLGTWYRPEPMLRLFALVRRSNGNAKFLFLTPDSREAVEAIAARAGVPIGSVQVMRATREEMPGYLHCLDVGISFIEPCFSKKSSSATKVGEYLAMGLPVIANSGIGDQDSLLGGSGTGFLVQDFSDESLEAAAEAIPRLRAFSASAIRGAAERELSLERANEAYDAIYRGAGVQSRAGFFRRRYGRART